MLRGVPEVPRSAPESCAESRSRRNIASKAGRAETLRRKPVARKRCVESRSRRSVAPKAGPAEALRRKRVAPKRCVVPGPGFSRQIVQGVGWSESHCQTSSRTVWQNLHSIVLF